MLNSYRFNSKVQHIGLKNNLRGCLKISLTRIFHTDRDEEDAKADGVRRVMKSDNGCMKYPGSIDFI